jgi:hypothetical protein
MPRYDLFQLNQGSWPLWLGSAETIQDAQAQSNQLTDCSECFALDYLTDEKIILKPTPVSDSV